MSRIRLLGGEHGGRRIEVPGSIRPTSGRVREALMSIWGSRLDGVRLLELFAGSGAVGLEALGRGAAEVVFVERDAAALEVLRRNVASLGVGGACRVVQGTLPEATASLVGPFGLAFADPPYGFDAYDDLVAAVKPLLAADGELVVEHARHGDWRPDDLPGLGRLETRRYGDSLLTRFRRGR